MEKQHRAKPGIKTISRNFETRPFFFPGLYITCVLLLTALSLVATLIILNLHDNMEVWPAPRWLSRCMRHKNNVDDLAIKDRQGNTEYRSSLQTTEDRVKIWKKIIKKLDRLFFILFLAAVVILQIALFFPSDDMEITPCDA